MNCKAGDLAIVVRVHQDRFNWAIGKIVRCKSANRINDLDGWTLEDPISQSPDSKYTWRWVADRCLKPIRDPGDDAKDETLSWRNVPQKVEA